MPRKTPRPVMSQDRGATRVAGGTVLTMLDDATRPVILDVRADSEWRGASRKIPGAIHLRPEEVERRYRDLPRDRLIVAYAEDERTGARVAL